jgi:histidinol dehydrogenase
MRILRWNTLDRTGRRAAMERPSTAAREDIVATARGIIERVRREGDYALLDLTLKYDRVRLDSLVVPERDIVHAQKPLGAENLRALQRAITNIRRFHAPQVRPAEAIDTEPGVRCEQIVRPIHTVGLYVPGGSAPLPSALLMLAVPAEIAGCAQRVLCTPPAADGSIHPAILAAAGLCGIDTIFKVGGAQAIAALAYGTESIPKVDKIFGPGNAWVTAAKQLVAQDPAGAACDLPAGPSEVLVVADGAARADFVCADLLAQAEHDPLSQAILVTDSAALAQTVVEQLDVQRWRLARSREVLNESLKSCRCILVPDLETALQVSNEYAPEHLILQVEDPRRWIAHVRNAGAVFLGAWSPEALGDYCSGTNHVLPTYGYARSYSGLTVRDFVRTISVQEVTAEGLHSLGPTAARLAELEGLDGHAQSIERRLAVLKKVSETAQDRRLKALDVSR